jgi:Phytanoyl-CoA dioxygenase (PhyH)
VPAELNFDRDGAVRLERAALSILPELEALLAGLPNDRAGVRIYGRPELAAILSPDSRLGQMLRPYVVAQHRPVRAILFDKSAETNWTLGWHQDRTIAVKERRDVAGFGPWSVKAGVQHVEPPFEMIEHMVTARIHLDDVPNENAPLLIALGSHRMGKLRESEIGFVTSQNPIMECIASVGDVWIYSTPIVHASAASDSKTRRRVLQVDYAPFDLPGDLEWQGI